tara:strand:+ start:349 stop:711 length:363 start_codon:yes stop_codon:yes gene_type:complete
MKILYDSQCPICIRNKLFLKKRDNDNKLEFIDIHQDKKELNTLISKYKKIDFNNLSSQIHVIHNNYAIGGMDAIRIIYSEIGYKNFIKLTNLPIFKKIFNILYKFISKNRLKISKFLNLK